MNSVIPGASKGVGDEEGAGGSWRRKKEERKKKVMVVGVWRRGEKMEEEQLNFELLGLGHEKTKIT